MPWNSQGGGWQAVAAAGARGADRCRAAGRSRPTSRSCCGAARRRCAASSRRRQGGSAAPRHRHRGARGCSCSGSPRGFYRVAARRAGRRAALRQAASGSTTPGLNYHLPAPIESVLTPQVTRVNRDRDRLPLGRRAPGQRPAMPATSPTRALMLTGDENIVDINFVVLWQIKDAARLSVQHPRSRGHGEGRGRERDARDHRPDARSSRRTTEGRRQIETTRPRAAPAADERLRCRHPDRRGAAAEGRSAGRGDRRLPRRAAGPGRPRARAERGRGLSPTTSSRAPAARPSSSCRTPRPTSRR